MGYEIDNMLVLSTAHVEFETSLLINWPGTRHPPDSELPWGPKMARDEGWLFHVPAFDEPGEFEAFFASLPADLVAPFKLAVSQGCQWILFDRDGPEASDLPSYEW